MKYLTLSKPYPAIGKCAESLIKVGKVVLSNNQLPEVAIMPRCRRLFAEWPIDHLEPQFLPGQGAGQAMLEADQRRRMPGFPFVQAGHGCRHHATRTMRTEPFRYRPPIATPPAAAAVSFA